MATTFDTFNKLVEEYVATRPSESTSRIFLENDTLTFKVGNVDGDRVQQPKGGGVVGEEERRAMHTDGGIRQGP